MEAELKVLAVHPKAVLVEVKTRAGTDRKEWIVRDKDTWAELGATSITTPERAWELAAERL
jgi:hypothetical protein